MNEKYKFYIPGLKERLMSFYETPTEKDLAEFLGEKPGSFNHYLIGRSAIPYDVLIKIYSSTNRSGDTVNLGWLLTGIGSETLGSSYGGIETRNIFEEASRLIKISMIDAAVILLGIILKSLPEVSDWNLKGMVEACDVIQKKALNVDVTVSVDEATMMLRLVRQITSQLSLASPSSLPVKKKDTV
jgi:hypothetical protein